MINSLSFAKSANQRKRRNKRSAYLTYAVDKIINSYWIKNHTQCTITGLVVAGPGTIKNDLAKNEEFSKYLGSLLLNVDTTSTIRDNTVIDVYNNNINYFAGEEDKEALALLDEIIELIQNADEKLVFGREVDEGLENYMLAKVLYCTDEKLEAPYDCTIIKTSEAIMSKLNGLNKIGIKFY